MPGALRRRGDEHLRAGDQLEAAGVVLADPRLVIIQPIEMLEQFEIALDRERRVLVVVVERREKNAAAQIQIVHAESSGRKPTAADRPPSAYFPQANFPCLRVPAIMAAITFRRRQTCQSSAPTRCGAFRGPRMA